MYLSIYAHGGSFLLLLLLLDSDPIAGCYPTRNHWSDGGEILDGHRSDAPVRQRCHSAQQRSQAPLGRNLRRQLAADSAAEASPPS